MRHENHYGRNPPKSKPNFTSHPEYQAHKSIITMNQYVCPPEMNTDVKEIPTNSSNVKWPTDKFKSITNNI